MKIICRNCGKEEKHYAKGLCRNCYTVFNRQGFTDVKELKAYCKGRKDKHDEVVQKKEKKNAIIANLRATTSNEFERAPRSGISQQMFNWYYNGTDKYLIFACGDNERLRKNVYNTAYGMTKRRHRLNIKRHQKKGDIILERVTA